MESLFASLEQCGWAFADGLLPKSLEQGLFLECQESWQKDLFKKAHIGRGPEKSLHTEIRGDAILWLDTERNSLPYSLPNSPLNSHPSSDFLQWAANLGQELNRRYFLGLRSEEFHFARFPAGTGYQKHIDQHRGSQFRKISLVLYLNPIWNPQDGGELCIYSPENESLEVQRISPQGGRLVLFRSDLVPHAVLPCFQTRWSLTGWFRTDLITDL